MRFKDENEYIPDAFLCGNSCRHIPLLDTPPTPNNSTGVSRRGWASKLDERLKLFCADLACSNRKYFVIWCRVSNPRLPIPRYPMTTSPHDVNRFRRSPEPGLSTARFSHAQQWRTVALAGAHGSGESGGTIGICANAQQWWPDWFWGLIRYQIFGFVLHDDKLVHWRKGLALVITKSLRMAYSICARVFFCSRNG